METEKLTNNKEYMSALDLMNIIPNLTYDNAIKYINEIRKEMEERGYCVPTTRPKLALTKLIKKKFGW